MLGLYFGMHDYLFLALGALLPDIDSGKSLIGSFFRPISWATEHRGFFHTIYMAIILAVILDHYGHGIAFFVGYISHLALDMLNHQGIALFYPSRYRIKGPFKSGGIADKLLLVIFIIAIGLKIVFWKS